MKRVFFDVRFASQHKIRQKSTRESPSKVVCCFLWFFAEIRGALSFAEVEFACDLLYDGSVGCRVRQAGTEKERKKQIRYLLTILSIPAHIPVAQPRWVSCLPYPPRPSASGGMGGSSPTSAGRQVYEPVYSK